MGLTMAVIPAILLFLCFANVAVIAYIDEMYGKYEAQEEYDYIVVGAGSAGAVVASRLSENPVNKVLLLEAGGAPPGMSDIPMLGLGLLGNPSTDWNYYTEPQENCLRGSPGQRGLYARGKMLGGCSSVNCMIYVRGNSRDYDRWAESGATGWSWKEVLPFFKKSEDASTYESIVDDGYHGRDGNLTVSPLAFATPLVPVYLEAAEAIGYPNKLDNNDGNPSGFTPTQVTQRDGHRCSTEKAFLRSATNRDNFDIVIYAHVTKVLFSGTRAVGVQFVKNNQTKNVKASKEVILSAGAVNSPHILLLSGIGPEKHLKDYNIPVIADAQVGYNLQDHVSTGGLFWALNQSVGIIPSHLFSPEVFGKFEEGRGPLTSPASLEAMGFVNTFSQNKSLNWPDCQIFVSSAFVNLPGANNDAMLASCSNYSGGDTVTMLPLTIRPESRGRIELNSSDPFMQPKIDPSYFQKYDDMRVIVDCMQIAMQFMDSAPMKRFAPKRYPDVLPGCEDSVSEERKYLECVARTWTYPGWHMGGTCKMGSPTDPTAVVDPQLRVKGVQGLRIADASIMPYIVSGNPSATCIMIGEKAADMILNENINKS